jgi:DNA-binding MarR family transcriptional regulator
VPDDPGVRAWAALLRAHAAVLARLEREMQSERGLPIAWYDVLLTLSGAPAGLRMQEVSEGVVLSRTRVSRVVDEMASAGLVERRPNPADRRSTIVTMTATGRSAFKRAAPVYLRGIAEHFTDRLSADELRCVREALEKVVAAQKSR